MASALQKIRAHSGKKRLAEMTAEDGAWRDTVPGRKVAQVGGCHPESTMEAFSHLEPQFSPRKSTKIELPSLPAPAQVMRIR